MKCRRQLAFLKLTGASRHHYEEDQLVTALAPAAPPMSSVWNLNKSLELGIELLASFCGNPKYKLGNDEGDSLINLPSDPAA